MNDDRDVIQELSVDAVTPMEGGARFSGLQVC